MWNGTAETLNAKPTANSPTARSTSVGGPLDPCASATPIGSSRVDPVTV